MKELSLSKRFALIAWNGVNKLKNEKGKYLECRCTACAGLFDLILSDQTEKGGKKYRLEENPNAGNAAQIILEKLGKTKENTIGEWIKEVEKWPQSFYAKLSKTIVEELVQMGMLDEIHSLLECDLNYQTSGVEIKEYRSSYDRYHMEIESIRAEILEEGNVSDETIALLWLLKQSGNIKYFFSKEEWNTVQEHLNRLYRENSFAHDLFDASIGGSGARAEKSLLDDKKDLAKTPFGRGVAFRIPCLQRDESIFIETEKMFSNSKERLVHVKKILESKGHIFQIKEEGEVSVAEIDNVMYELIPDAVTIRFLSVHGVRLRRYSI